MSDISSTENGSGSTGGSGWMSDVQRAIALILIGVFALVVFASTVKFVFTADAATLNDMAKTLQAALVNTVLIALGFFFGSNQAKQQADAGQQKIVEKLTSKTVGTPSVVVSWWSLLTQQEQDAIKAAASGDAGVQAVLTSLQAGKAESPDLAYLVSKGLLTPERLIVISK